MKKYFEITVAGRGRFPLDMLRHSQCWPVTTQDAENIETIEVDARPHHRTIRLGMIGNYPQAQACCERFQSFLWSAQITQEETAA